MDPTRRTPADSLSRSPSLRPPELLDEALADLRAAADAVAQRPGIARRARWRGGLERSVRRWRKLLVLEQVADQVRVLALYDQRQDLSAVDPFSK